jgi:orotidine-5'-phosphate decarboxylase
MNQQCGLIVNSARAIIYASSEEDFAEAARKESKKLQLSMSSLLDEYCR